MPGWEARWTVIEHIRDHVLPAALSLLPDRMDSPEADAMLLAIGLQESRFTHRRQVRGPARGFWQFEVGGVSGVLRHTASAEHLRNACAALHYAPAVADVHGALADNDTLACVVARLLLWTLPSPLPRDAEGAWEQYIDAWRPGKPHRGTWDAFYAQAWATLTGD